MGYEINSQCRIHKFSIFLKKEMIQCQFFFERIGEIGQKVSAKLLNITTEVYLPKPITYL